MPLTKASYSMITGAPVNAFDFMTSAEIADVQAGTLTVDVSASLQAAITAATGRQLWLPTGKYRVQSTLDLPQFIRITGETNRGNNSQIVAFFAGPAIRRTNATVLFCEIYLEHFQVQGRYDIYPAGNGIEVLNSTSFNMHSMVVAGFGTNQINIGAGSYGAIIRDVYVAETYNIGTSNANIYCASEYCLFDKIESDDAKFSMFFATGSYGCDVTNCTLEGATNSIINLQNNSTIDRTLISGNKINGTRGGVGIYTDSNRTHIINNAIVMSAASVAGVQLANNSYGSIIDGNSINGAITGVTVENSGLNVISNNEISGSSVALDMTGGVGFPTYTQIVSDNQINSSGITLRHNQNSKTSYVNNVFENASGVYSAPSILAGTPNILSKTTTNLTMISGVMEFPASTLVVAGGAGTGVVSVGAADSAGAGFRLLRIPN